MYPDMEREWKMGMSYDVALVDWSCGPQFASARPVRVESTRGQWIKDERVVF